MKIKMTREEYQSRNYSFEDIPDDPRLAQAHKEMLVTFFSYLIYVIIILSVSYYFAAQDMQQMQYLFGLPRYLTIMAMIAVLGGFCISLPEDWLSESFETASRVACFWCTKTHAGCSTQ